MTPSSGGGPMTPVARVAGLMRITEGQMYTVITGLALALVLLGLGLPSLRDIAPQVAGELVRTRPLPLPGSPAVAEAIAATPALPLEVSSDAAFVSTPSTAPSREAVTPQAASGPSEITSSAPPVALRVTEARYATASGPLVPSGPPGTFLPVGLRLGAPDKQSYLRLSGSGTTLEVKLSIETGHQFGEVNAVRACRIVPAAWKIEDGSPLAAAPKVDPIDCTFGRPGATGWTFELSSVDARNGVALVPAGPSTGTFQVTFSR